MSKNRRNHIEMKQWDDKQWDDFQTNLSSSLREAGDQDAKDQITDAMRLALFQLCMQKAKARC